MTNLSTTYLGLQLKNPIIVASSGLTSSIKRIIEMEKHGAGAIVLKSLFEEQIMMEATEDSLQNNDYNTPEANEYLSRYSKDNSIDAYLQLIEHAKKEVDIPIIASINCVSSNEWVSFAKQIEEAGADALELNIAIFPSNPKQSGQKNEQIYFNILKKLKISIPISIKLSYYSAGLSQLIQKLDWTEKIKGVVMFNRYYNPDIDINALKIVPSNVLSSPSDIYTTLRWIALLHGQVKCDLSATTGIHDAEGVIKQLLAGATTVQVASTLYQNGIAHLSTLIEGLEKWMEEKDYQSISQYRGKLSHKNLKEPSVLERTQFMRYFNGK